MNVWEKILRTLGLLEEEGREENFAERAAPRKQLKRGKVVEFPSPEASCRLVVHKPEGFNEIEGIATHLKNKRAIVVNLENMDPGEAKRTVDFLSGVIFALNGNSQKITHNIFIFAPSGVALNADGQLGLKERDLLFKNRSELFNDEE